MLIPRSLRPRFGTLLAKKGWYFFASFVFCDLGFFSSYLFFFCDLGMLRVLFCFFFFLSYWAFLFVISWMGFYCFMCVFELILCFVLRVLVSRLLCICDSEQKNSELGFGSCKFMLES
jgi:hypothetical protein